MKPTVHEFAELARQIGKYHAWLAFKDYAERFYLDNVRLDRCSIGLGCRF